MSKVSYNDDTFHAASHAVAADEVTMCQEALKIILEEYIFPHYGVTVA